ncbi:hypothetical protein M0R45_002322 [Rubus argutus]|uniref:Uncharacterized protein n=1 Tax=Rubus argutus TaxID=59490 RepID=A0AAW1VEB9_RUBAR
MDSGVATAVGTKCVESEIEEDAHSWWGAIIDGSGIDGLAAEQRYGLDVLKLAEEGGRGFLKEDGVHREHGLRDHGEICEARAAIVDGETTEQRRRRDRLGSLWWLNEV